MTEIQSPSTDLDLEHNNIRAIKVLGQGGMGTVFLVHDRISDPSARCPFALKVVEKSSFHSKLDADRRARWEVSVLTLLTDPYNSHPLLPSLLGSFETNDLLAWAVPFCPGGDLNVLRYQQTDHVFSPSVIRFYLAEIVISLQHLHGLGIVYRDLKPENVLIQNSGHVTLTDFDLSRKLKPRAIQVSVHQIEAEPPWRKCRRNLWRFISTAISDKKIKSSRVSPVNRRKTSFSDGERSNSFVGTEEYVAPEVVRGDGHEFAVDWWALGVLTYEMLYGSTPFRGKTRKETFRNILVEEPVFIGKPNSLTDLIEKLLQKDPTRRLGYRRGACDIKEHEFFRGLKWEMLTEVLRPPFLPLRDDLQLMLVSTNTGTDIRDYFNSLRVPPSPLQSLSLEDYQPNVSLTEF